MWTKLQKVDVGYREKILSLRIIVCGEQKQLYTEAASLISACSATK